MHRIFSDINANLTIHLTSSFSSNQTNSKAFGKEILSYMKAPVGLYRPFTNNPPKKLATIKLL